MWDNDGGGRGFLFGRKQLAHLIMLTQVGPFMEMIILLVYVSTVLATSVSGLLMRFVDW